MSYEGTHPGIYLRRVIMEPLDMRISTMTRILCMSESSTYKFLSGRGALDGTMAERLGAFFDMMPSFWLDLQTADDKALHEQALHEQAVLARSTETEEENKLPPANMPAHGEHPMKPPTGHSTTKIFQ